MACPSQLGWRVTRSLPCWLAAAILRCLGVRLRSLGPVALRGRGDLALVAADLALGRQLRVVNSVASAAA
jgi:hypothetical protein